MPESRTLTYRSLADRDGVRHLEGAVYLPRPCGCEVVGDGTVQAPFEVRPCDQHGDALADEDESMQCERCERTIGVVGEPADVAPTGQWVCLRCASELRAGEPWRAAHRGRRP